MLLAVNAFSVFSPIKYRYAAKCAAFFVSRPELPAESSEVFRPSNQPPKILPKKDLFSS